MIATVPPPTELVAAFWARYRATGEVDRAAARRLAAQAIGEGPEAEAAVKALFAEIVEPLGDAFEAAAAHAYVDAFAEVVDVARRHPRAAELDRGLAELGLSNEVLVARGHAVLNQVRPEPIGAPSLVVVPSQVTFGAEVAITSTIVAGVLERLPRAEVLFLAQPALRGIFAGNRRVRFRAVDYPRRGDLLTRLAAWSASRAIVQEETAGLPTEAFLIVDTDSRITQTNLLPLAPAERTRYFPKRTFEAPPLERLGELAGVWTQRLTGLAERPQPTLWLPDEARAWAGAVRGALSSHAKRWAVVNFGVGGNAAKGLGSAFEAQLLRGLIERDVGVLLARGVSPAEHAGPDQLAHQLAVDGVDVSRIPADNGLGGLATSGRRQLVLWEASTERMATLVEAADLHVGYDSQGQHFAAALGTPSVTAFVPTGGERFFRRWSPYGTGPTRIVRVEPGSADPLAAAEAALQAASELLEA
jgi:plasmid stabilization system protein ParE